MNELILNYEYITICQFHNSYYYTTNIIRHLKNAYSIRTFQLSNPSHCYLELTQLDSRYFRNSSHCYLNSRMIIAEKEINGNLKYIDGINDKMRNMNLELYLAAGFYYIIVILEYEQQIFDSTLSYNGEESINIEKCNYKINKNLLECIMGNVAINYGTKFNLLENGGLLYFYVSISDSIIIEHFINDCDNPIYLKRDYSIYEKFNGKILGKHMNKKNVEMKLKKNKKETILIKIDKILEIDEIFKNFHLQ